ncbi:unnamed protein product, partial [Heterosigma akashiwo]
CCCGVSCNYNKHHHITMKPSCISVIAFVFFISSTPCYVSFLFSKHDGRHQSFVLPGKRTEAVRLEGKRKFVINEEAANKGDYVFDGGIAQNVKPEERRLAMSKKDIVLYVKAGPDGESLGDCPFAHFIQMCLQRKRLAYDLRPCTAATKPSWLADHYEGKMPCLVHKGEATRSRAWWRSTWTSSSRTCPWCPRAARTRTGTRTRRRRSSSRPPPGTSRARTPGRGGRTRPTCAPPSGSSRR